MGDAHVRLFTKPGMLLKAGTLLGAELDNRIEHGLGLVACLLLFVVTVLLLLIVMGRDTVTMDVVA